MVEREAGVPQDGTAARVLIAADSDLVQAGLRLLLQSEATLQLVGVIRTPAQAAALPPALPLDLVLVDFRDLEQGLAMAGAFDERQPRPRTLLFVERLDRKTMHAVVAARISGCIRRPGASPVLLQAIRSVHGRPGHGTLFLYPRD